MRIITGKARGVRLFTLDGDATRPTSERAKEAIFSMLQFELEGRTVLDLFGGSGQLALEALSRGAKSAVIADSSRQAIEIIRKNAEKTRLAELCSIMCSDWTQTLKRLADKKFDIVFLDPPYNAGIVPTILEKISVNLKETSVVVCETGNDISLFVPQSYEILKNVKYGIAYVTVLKFKGEN